MAGDYGSRKGIRHAVSDSALATPSEGGNIVSSADLSAPNRFAKHVLSANSQRQGSVDKKMGDEDSFEAYDNVVHAEALAEYRVRIISGLKRYFHSKHEQGLLSGHGMRILDYCCGVSADQPDKPIDLWSTVEEEVSGYGWVAWLHFNIRWDVIWLRNSNWPLRRYICKFLQWVAAVRYAPIVLFSLPSLLFLPTVCNSYASMMLTITSIG